MPNPCSNFPVKNEDVGAPNSTQIDSFSSNRDLSLIETTVFGSHRCNSYLTGSKSDDLVSNCLARPYGLRGYRSCGYGWTRDDNLMIIRLPER